MNAEKAEELSPELQRALEPLLSAIEELSERIAEYNEKIEALAQESYPASGTAYDLQPKATAAV